MLSSEKDIASKMKRRWKLKIVQGHCNKSSLDARARTARSVHRSHSKDKPMTHSLVCLTMEPVLGIHNTPF